MSKCIMAVTLDVSDKAYEVLSMIKDQHTFVNMSLNLDGSITISQTVEDEVELWNGYVGSDDELVEVWRKINGETSSNKFPF